MAAAHHGGPHSSRSDVWTHFRKSKDKNKVICKVCVEGMEWKTGDKGVLTYKTGSTSMMWEHLRRIHNILNKPDVKPFSVPAKRNKITSFAIPPPNATKPCSLTYGGNTHSVLQVVLNTSNL